MRVFRSLSEEIDDEDVWYYCMERCAEAGEEYDPELKWLDSESELGSEDHQKGSSGSGSGVLGSSSGKYFASTGISNGWPVAVEFVHLAGGGYAPDVRGNYRDVGDGLVGPGVAGGFSEKHLKGSQEG